MDSMKMAAEQYNVTPLALRRTRLHAAPARRLMQRRTLCQSHEVNHQTLIYGQVRACMQHLRAASCSGVRPRVSRRSAAASFIVSCTPRKQRFSTHLALDPLALDPLALFPAAFHGSISALCP